FAVVLCAVRSCTICVVVQVNRHVLRNAAITGRKPARPKESFSPLKPKKLSNSTGSANRQDRSFSFSAFEIKNPRLCIVTAVPRLGPWPLLHSRACLDAGPASQRCLGG